MGNGLKPPLGVVPEYIWKQQRFEEVCYAIQRYFDAFKPIPQEWIDERYELGKWLYERDEKQSKPEKDWEILEMSWANSFNHKQDRHCEGNGCKIFSVKRLSDNEVFSVGDSVCLNWYPSFDVKQPIERFEIVNDQMIVHYDCGCYQLKYAMLNPKHKPKQVLFTTEDGVDVYVGDKYWAINYKDFIGRPVEYNAMLGCGQMPNLKNFSTKEKAEEYITLHKPSLSIDDIMNLADKSGYESLKYLKNKLIEIVKQKSK